MSPSKVKASFATFGFAVPLPEIGLILGGLHWSFLKTILVTAISFGIYDLVEAMDNVVSAQAAGDTYPTTRGLAVLGDGSILSGVVLGAVAVFIIDRELTKAAAFAMAGAVMTFFGLMQGEVIGVNKSPTVAASYLIVSGVLFAAAKGGAFSAAVAHVHNAEEEEDHGEKLDAEPAM